MPAIRVDFDKACKNATRRLSAVALQIEDNFCCDNFCLVGGSVRDIFIGELLGRKISVKDYDMIMPTPPHLDGNKNILNSQKNSFGGIKLTMRDIGIVDIFHKYTDDVPAFIATKFDFTCNSLYYSHQTRSIECSVYFYHFLETLALRMCVGYQASPESIAIRAIKFKMKFASEFGLKVRLGDDIMALMRAMDKSNDAAALRYAQEKIYNADLYRRTIGFYYSQRGRVL